MSLTNMLKLAVLKPAEELFELDGRRFVIRQALAGAVAAQKDFMYGQAELDAQGRIKSMRGFVEADLVLLSMCLWEYYEGPVQGQQQKERPVPLQEIKSWPTTVTDPLVAWVKEHSDLTPDETKESLEQQRHQIDVKLAALSNGHAPGLEEQAKNLPSATTQPSS